jgi:hypothetical protein
MTRFSLLLFASALVAAAPALAQQSAYKPPRTPDGKPELTGTWSNASMTRLERNPQYKALVMTPDEVAKAEGNMAKTVADRNAPTKEGTQLKDLPCDPGNCGYNQGWVDPGYTVMRVRGEPRTSFITSTPNGRIPPLTAEAQARVRNQPQRIVAGGEDEEEAAGGRDVFTVRAGGNDGQNDNPETRSIGERCLVFGGVGGPIMQPSLYNNTYQFVQDKDHLAIVVEMIHDVRVIPIGTSKADAQAKRRNDGVRSYYGETVGWWEGDTLVTESKNFHPSQSLRGSNQNLTLTEKFSRVAPDRVLYQFTVEDPTTWTQPWSGEYEFGRASGQVYEYACHEGNYGLQNILAGARMEERDAAARPAGQASR